MHPPPPLTLCPHPSVPRLTRRLERVIREACVASDHARVKKIIHELCHDYAYAVHAPYARNGGLIGLAAASIALGPEVARYLDEIVPPVLACFTDQDARVRYYACESMYNIAKVAKGELLLFFNDVFDALCKLAADSELSVKNGAELLDRLVKDIVSESASTYVSVLHQDPDGSEGAPGGEKADEPAPPHTAFSLARFIPLLEERIFVINPFTRVFLVSWLTLLDSIPDLELVFYLPAFLGGLFPLPERPQPRRARGHAGRAGALPDRDPPASRASSAASPTAAASAAPTRSAGCQAAAAVTPIRRSSTTTTTAPTRAPRRTATTPTRAAPTTTGCPARTCTSTTPRSSTSSWPFSTRRARARSR